MLDEEQTNSITDAAPETQATEADAPVRRRRRSAARPAGPPEVAAANEAADGKGTAEPAAENAETTGEDAAGDTKPTARRRSRKATASVSFAAPVSTDQPAEPVAAATTGALSVPLFQPPPEPVATPRRSKPAVETEAGGESDEAEGSEAPAGGRRRRSRNRAAGGTGKAAEDKGGDSGGAEAKTGEDATQVDREAQPESEEGEEEGGARRRRRRRRRSGNEEDSGNNRKDEPAKRDEVTALKGSTRIEAKKQRRREGRESGRRRAPIVSEAEFLARRESVKRTMVVRQQGMLTQIAVLEDGVLVEHYVNQATAASLVGNVYLGRVQNVLPSMEAAFVDVGRGRNAVLYAGEVNWDAAGLEGQPKRIEQALSSGDKVLVQVTKDPVGHKGARLTSQISLPGRFVVYVPDGSITGISRKLPDKERSRLRSILRSVLPAGAGVIVRTAAEGASEEDLTRDVQHLMATWEQIQTKAEKANPPSALHAETDLALRIVRDIFNSDFEALVVSGDEASATLTGYVSENAPGLADRVTKWTADKDVFAEYRVDEQLAKALDRKVYLPSGGSLVIDRTEAMTVIDVNTGRFTGQGGNLEETVTRNNLEAAEEIARQIRLRDVGGILVIDFIDMVLESNRDLVLRRLIECLGRDRTKHQVAEVTSLGLVQMTRKRIGQGLLETFSEPCECCNGRGVKVHGEPVEKNDRERRPRSVRPPGAHDPVEAAAARAAARAAEQSDGAAATDEADTSASLPEEPEDDEVEVDEDLVDDVEAEDVDLEEDLEGDAPVDTPDRDGQG